MANLALGAPTRTLGGITAVTGLQAASETSLGANTGFTFANNGLVLVHYCVGASGAGNVQFTATTGSNPAVIATTNNASYWWGPFDPAVYSDMAGLCLATVSVNTGNSVAAYYLPAGTMLRTYRALHYPFEMVQGATDS